MKFDWYQAGIEETQPVIEQVRKLGHEVRQADAAARRWRYQQGWEILHETRGTVALVMAGGNGDRTHALATSDAAEPFAALVRECWPDRHLVTRVDAAEDFYEVGTYAKLRKWRGGSPRPTGWPSRSTATPSTTRQAVPSTSVVRRATTGAGSTKKGWEEFGKVAAMAKQAGFGEEAISNIKLINAETGELIDPEDWTRQELQVRPKKEEARRLVATLTPEQCWGCTPWAQDLARQTMALDLERIVMRTHKRTKDDEALRWMCNQYAGPLQRLRTRLGGAEAVGVEVMRLIDQMAAGKRS